MIPFSTPTMTATLDDNDTGFSMAMGAERHGEAEAHRRRLRFPGDDAKVLQQHQTAVGSELGFSLLTGIRIERWINTFAGPDVGPYQVRHTAMRGSPVRVEPKDRLWPDMPVVCATGKFPTFTYRGWVFVWEAMGREEWRAFMNDKDGGIWLVPLECAHPMNELPTPMELLHLRAIRRETEARERRAAAVR